MPLTQLAALYVSSGFRPSDERVREIQAAGEAVMGAYEGEHAALTRLCLGLPSREGEDLKWFLGPFQEADRTFTEFGDGRLASLYASGVALELLAKRDSAAVNLALCLLSASMSNKRGSPACPDLVEDAQEHLGAIQQLRRRRPKLNLAASAALDTASLLQAAESLTTNQAAAAGPFLKAFEGVLAAHVKQLDARTAAIRTLDAHLRLLDEEQSSLWWFVGGTSKGLEVAFSSLPASCAAVVAGHELAAMRHEIAGAAGAAALLDMSLKLDRKREKVMTEFALVDAVGDTLPVAWRKANGVGARDRGVQDLCPLATALLMSTEDGSPQEWRAAYARRYPAAAAARFTPLELAMQAYREACYLSVP